MTTEQQLSHDAEVAHLRLALESSRLIGKAIGIVMERYGLDDDKAFATLQRVSSTEQMKVHAVAERLVRTGLLYGPQSEPDAPGAPQG